MEIPQLGVGIIVWKDKQILLGKRKGKHGNGSWGTPGGKMNFKETPEQCAERELTEETGLIAMDLIKGPWVNCIFEKENLHFVSLFFVVTEFEGDLKNNEPELCEGWQWFPMNSLPSPLFAPLENLFDQLNQVGVKLDDLLVETWE